MQVRLTESAATTLAQLCAAHQTPECTAPAALYRLTRKEIGNTETEAELAAVWAQVVPLLPHFSVIGQRQIESLALSHLSTIRRQVERDGAPLIAPSLVQSSEKYGKVDI
jgi:hypothetical protein